MAPQTSSTPAADGLDTQPDSQLNAQLDPHLVAAIAAFGAQRPVIVASDFDGVLAPIVLRPMDATPLPGTVDALRRLASHDGVQAAVVSGRDLATLRQLTGLTASDPVILIGSHGAESSIAELTEHTSGTLTNEQRSCLAQAHSLLTTVVANFPAARIEEKPAGVVLHTRGMPDADAVAASERALNAAEALPGVHAMRGKSVVELSVTDTSKGAALTALAEQTSAAAVVYFGDDVTDETVFARFAQAPQHLTIKVGEGTSRARYRVDSPQDVQVVLQLLVDAVEALG